MEKFSVASFSLLRPTILRDICLFQETNRAKIFLVDYIKKNVQYKEKKFHSHVIQKKKKLFKRLKMHRCKFIKFL